MEEARKDYPSLRAAIESIAPKIGCAAVTLHEWVKKFFEDIDEEVPAIVDEFFSEEAQTRRTEPDKLQDPTEAGPDPSLLGSKLKSRAVREGR